MCHARRARKALWDARVTARPVGISDGPPNQALQLTIAVGCRAFGPAPSGACS